MSEKSGVSFLSSFVHAYNGLHHALSQRNMKVHFVSAILVGLVGSGIPLGLAEKTLILFTCDNGTAAGIESRIGDRFVTGGKGRMTDAGTHVPLIARWPGVIAPGSVSRDLIDFSDFLPTLLDAAGAPAPEGLDGRSFLPQLRGEKGTPREWVYSWYARDGGTVGQELVRSARERGVALAALSHDEADIADRAAVEAAIARVKPALVVNAAAYTKVDLAETEIEAARRGNETGPAVIAAANGGNSIAFNRSRAASISGMPTWVSTAVAPGPGKCFTVTSERGFAACAP